MTNSIQSLPFAEPLSSPQPKGQNHRSCAHLAHNRVPQSKRRSKHLKAKLLHLPHGDAPASRFEPSRHFLSLPVHADHAVAVCCFTCPWGFGFGCGWQFCPDSKSGFVGMNVMNVPCGFHRTSSKCVTLCFSMHTPQLGTSASHISFTNALLPAALKPRFFSSHCYTVSSSWFSPSSLHEVFQHWQSPISQR